MGDGTFSERGASRTEVGAADSYARWFEPFFAFVREHTDVIRGVTYINSDWDTQGQWGPPYENGYFGDSRVQASPESRERWLAELRQEPWIAGL